MDSKFYELTVQIWEDEQDGCFYWSVIQEFREDGRDAEKLGYGQTSSWEDASHAAGEQVKSLF